MCKAFFCSIRIYSINLIHHGQACTDISLIELLLQRLPDVPQVANPVYRGVTDPNPIFWMDNWTRGYYSVRYTMQITLFCVYITDPDPRAKKQSDSTRSGSTALVHLMLFINTFILLCIHSFVHSFIYLLIQLFTNSFIYLYTHLFFNLFFYNLPIFSFIN